MGRVSHLKWDVTDVTDRVEGRALVPPPPQNPIFGCIRHQFGSGIYTTLWSKIL